jgi:hypothetical protein
MARVEVTKTFLWAPDGNHVREVPVGEVLEGEGAEIAMQMQSGRVLDDETAVGAAPDNRAAPRAPRTKGKG